ncbi:olfactory receptor 6N2-like [Mantella aurantiaca]
MYPGHIMCWHRYIDDIFLVWGGPLPVLDEFLGYLNTNEKNLSFTMTRDSTTITFLDLTIYRDNQDNLQTELYHYAWRGVASVTPHPRREEPPTGCPGLKPTPNITIYVLKTDVPASKQIFLSIEVQKDIGAKFIPLEPEKMGTGFCCRKSCQIWLMHIGNQEESVGKFIGNGSISSLIFVEKHLHAPMYLFIGMLSFLEILYTTVTIPCMLTIIWKHSTQISFNYCMMQMYLFHSFGITENYLLNIMAYDRMVAICNPLRYHAIMTFKRCKILISGCWVLGFLSPVMLLKSVSQLPFCGPNEINHLFCDSSPILKLACTDTSFNFIIDFAISLCMIILTSLFLIVTYVKIIITILKMKYSKVQKKAFSTCASHLTVVLFFYGSVAFMYIRPQIMYTPEYDKLVAINYSVLTPLLNPIIYSLRNKEIINSLKKVTASKISYSKHFRRQHLNISNTSIIVD